MDWGPIHASRVTRPTIGSRSPCDLNMTLANLVWTWMLGRYMLIPGGQKNPHPRRGRHLVVLLACERRHRAHISVAWRQRIVPFPSNSADPTSSHTSGVSPRFAVGHIHVVILDPDECVCHIHRSSTDLGKHLHSSRSHYSHASSWF
jgi:hypothetical protein